MKLNYLLNDFETRKPKTITNLVVYIRKKNLKPKDKDILLESNDLIKNIRFIEASKPITTLLIKIFFLVCVFYLET